MQVAITRTNNEKTYETGFSTPGILPRRTKAGSIRTILVSADKYTTGKPEWKNDPI
jgi:hypothetical protein